MRDTGEPGEGSSDVSESERDGSEGGAASEVCDGSARFRLEVVWESVVRDGGPYDFHGRNGSAFLRVDGSCRYFVGDYGVNSPVRSGELTGQEVVALANEVAYQAWGALAPGSPGVGDEFSGSAYLRDGQNEIKCGEGCIGEASESDEALLEQIRQAVQAAESWRVRLIAEGEPMSGPVRFVVFEHDLLEGEEFPWGFNEWPLSIPIQQFVVEYDSGDVEGFVATGEEAEALRLLRSKPASHPVYGQSDWVPFDGGDVFYHLSATDVLPYEDPVETCHGE